jgi:catalase
VADGIEGRSARALHEGLAEAGAVPRFVGVTLGEIQCEGAAPIEVEISMEAEPAVLYDALVVPDGEAGIQALAQVGHAKAFVQDQYRHAKPILVLGAGRALLDEVGVFLRLPSGQADPGILSFASTQTDAALEAFRRAIVQHRFFDRETDPPRI